MPIYEYECKSCGDVQEVMQKLADPPLADCPSCHKGPMVKLISRTAFVLKGEGWYVTDFRDKGKPAAAAAGGGVVKKGDGASESTTAETKSATAEKSDGKADKPAEKTADKPAASTSSGSSSGGTSL